MYIDLKRTASSLKFHIVNGSLSREISKRTKLHNKHNFDPYSFHFIIQKMLNDINYLETYHYINYALSSIDTMDNETICSNNYRIWKYILENNMDKAIHILDQMMQKMNDGKWRDEAAMFKYGLLGGNFYETECVKKNPYFVHLLYQKKVAILGPANDPEFNLDKISSEHDAIVIMNYSKEGSIAQYKFNPDCKVISYYNHEHFLKILDMAGSKQKLFYEPDALVMKSIEDINRLKKELSVSYRVRRKLDIEEFVYYGCPNMIQAAAFDLIQFRPKRIDIYGCNFFLDKNRYRESSYIGNKGMADNKKLICDLSVHNQILQYQILYYMYKNNRINPDNMLREILDFGIEEFCRKTENFFKQ